MKKIITKIIMAIGLLVLAIGLVACTKAGDDSGKGGKGKKDPSPEVKVDKMGYVSKFEKLDIETDASGYIRPMGMDGEYFYFIKTIYDEKSFEVNDTSYHCYNLSTKEDSSVSMKELIGENVYLQTIKRKSDGGFYALLGSFDAVTYEESYIVVTLNSFGEITNEFTLSDFLTGGDSYLSNYAFSDDGILYAVTDTRMIVIEVSSGIELFSINIDGWISDMFFSEDGTLYVSLYSMTDGQKRILPVDKGTKSFGKALMFGAFSSGNQEIFSTGGNTVLISYDTTAKSVNLSTGETKDLWNWFEVDMTENYFDELAQDKNGVYHIIYSEWDDDNKETIWHVTINEELIPADKQKTKILFGCSFLDWNVKKAIRDFNKLNSQYRVIPYTLENSEDYETAYNQFQNDVVSGKYDIIDTSSIDYVKLAKKGSFVDLYQYLKNNGSINMDDYFSNIFKANEVEGKLYAISPFAQISTMMVSKDLVGNKEKITLSDLLNFRKQYPNIAFMDYGTKTEAFFSGLFFSSDLFIDWENKTCNFMTQDFYDLLNYANSFPEEIDYSNYSEWSLLKSGDIKVANLSLYDMANYQVMKNLVGDDFVIIGYPTNKENGHMVSSYGGYAICEKSNNKEGAWEFIRSLLEIDFQCKAESGFPVLKSAFDEVMKKAMTDDGYTDSDGNFIKQPKTSWGDGTITVEVYAATQQEVDEIRKVMEIASNSYQYDEKMIEMISEEIEPFFKGQKNAEDVAAIIQSRVKIYLAENN